MSKFIPQRVFDKLRASPTKRCSGCRELKDVSEFTKNKRKGDGLNCYCKPCNHDYHARYRSQNIVKALAYESSWRNNNRDRSREIGQNWQKNNADRQREFEEKYRREHWDRRLASQAAYRAANPERDQINGKRWRAANKDRLASKSAARRAIKLKAMPIWATPESIAKIYRKAQRFSRVRGVPYHVDHIVPLVSKWVCGLHCEANLRVILGKKNLTKRNRSWPNMGSLAELIKRPWLNQSDHSGLPSVSRMYSSIGVLHAG